MICRQFGLMFSILLATYGTIESGRTKHSEQWKATVSRLRHARKIYNTIVEILEQNLANNPKLDGRSNGEFPPSLPGAMADNCYYQACWVKRYLDKVFSIQVSINKLLHFGFSGVFHSYLTAGVSPSINIVKSDFRPIPML